MSFLSLLQHCLGSADDSSPPPDLQARSPPASSRCPATHPSRRTSSGTKPAATTSRCCIDVGSFITIFLHIAWKTRCNMPTRSFRTSTSYDTDIVLSNALASLATSSSLDLAAIFAHFFAATTSFLSSPHPLKRQRARLY